jgi:hypothetical protein
MNWLRSKPGSMLTARPQQVQGTEQGVSPLVGDVCDVADCDVACQPDPDPAREHARVGGTLSGQVSEGPLDPHGQVHEIKTDIVGSTRPTHLNGQLCGARQRLCH